jgi:hypothetical protein
MRAQRTLCYGNTTSNTTSTTTLKNSSVEGAVVGLHSTAGPEYFSSDWAEVGVDRVLPSGMDMYMEDLGSRNLIGSQHSSSSAASSSSSSSSSSAVSGVGKKHEVKGSISEQQHSPRASICGKHPAIRIYRRSAQQTGLLHGTFTSDMGLYWSHSLALSDLFLCCITLMQLITYNVIPFFT